MSKNAGTSSRRKPKSSSAEGARDLAALVLTRVWADKAWASPTLDAELARQGGLDPRDARLTTELVYGVLRTGRYLERRIGRHASNDKWRRQHAVRAHLCIAAYTMLFLDRIPAFAAVSEAVDAIKRSGDRRVAGFVNAVLRKLAGETEKVTLDEAMAASLPRWLGKSLAASLDDEVARFLGGEPPTLDLVLAEGQDREAWIAKLQEARPEGTFVAGKLSPRCIQARRAGDQRHLPGSGEAWRVQEQGAQALGLIVGAQPGETVLDACAGRGGKAFLLREQVGPEGAVDAADLHPRKLERLRGSAAGSAIRDTFAVDWTKGRGAAEGPYDRILVDAPCSGVGTLRRRPEIADRLRPDDVARLRDLQIAIVERVAPLLRPGGRLFFAVCSVLREEGEAVVEAVTERTTLTPAAFDGSYARSLTGEATSLRLVPPHHPSDGYFMACFVAAPG